MAARLRRLSVAAAMLGAGCLAAAPAAQPIISVVTPATPSRWSAVAGGLLQLVDPWGDADKAALLRRMAKEDRFDLAKRVQQHLLEALAGRDRVALPLELTRPPELAPGPLPRDRLPDQPLPGLLLDVSVEWFGLYRRGSREAYRPMVAISYRVVGPRGALQQSSRRILFNVPAGVAKGGEAIAAEGDCAWKSFDEVARERARLWGCIDVSLERVAERIVANIEASDRSNAAGSPATQETP